MAREPVLDSQKKAYVTHQKQDVKDRVEFDEKNVVRSNGVFAKGNKPFLGKKRPDISKVMKGNKYRLGMKSPMKGKKHTEESKEKMRQAKLGRKLTEEHKKKVSDALKGKMPKNLSLLDNSGANSHWWKGGVTPENERIRKSKDFKHWRERVYERDSFLCQKCGKHSRSLHPHHIVNFAECKEVRFFDGNGVTMCEKCHRKFHKNYGLSENNYQQVVEYLLS